MWTKKQIEDLINNRVEENLELDYKAANALTTSKKKEIGKDVSAFANSAGGIIIYGVAEHNEKELRHLPHKLDPINRNDFSKERLEQIINSNIKPRISDLMIHPVEIDPDLNLCVYVVEIPQSRTAHQNKDHRYYKRFNFESVSMEDYEVKDVMNRSSGPDLHLNVQGRDIKSSGRQFLIPIIVENRSSKVARDCKIMLCFDQKKDLNVMEFQGFSNNSDINYGMPIYSSHLPMVYRGLLEHCGHFTIDVPAYPFEFTFVIKLFSDEMVGRSHRHKISLDERTAKVVLLEEAKL